MMFNSLHQWVYTIYTAKGAHMKHYFLQCRHTIKDLLIQLLNAFPYQEWCPQETYTQTPPNEYPESLPTPPMGRSKNPWP